MPRFCAAYGCTNSSSKKLCIEKNVSFHRFPLKDKEKLLQWIVQLKRKNFVPNQHSYLCSDHFVKEDFEILTPANKRRILKKDAIPTQFVFSKNVSKHKKTSHQNGCKEWVRISGNESLVNISSTKLYSSNFRVCSAHFDDSCFVYRTPDSKLLPNAVPCTNLQNKSTSNKIEKTGTTTISDITETITPNPFIEHVTKSREEITLENPQDIKNIQLPKILSLKDATLNIKDNIESSKVAVPTSDSKICDMPASENRNFETKKILKINFKPKKVCNNESINEDNVLCKPNSSVKRKIYLSNDEKINSKTLKLCKILHLDKNGRLFKSDNSVIEIKYENNKTLLEISPKRDIKIVENSFHNEEHKIQKCSEKVINNSTVEKENKEAFLKADNGNMQITYLNPVECKLLTEEKKCLSSKSAEDCLSKTGYSFDKLKDELDEKKTENILKNVMIILEHSYSNKKPEEIAHVSIQNSKKVNNDAQINFQTSPKSKLLKKLLLQKDALHSDLSSSKNPYYNLFAEKFKNFKDGTYKPITFPTMNLSNNEVIIESPSLVVPLLSKEVDRFPNEKVTNSAGNTIMLEKNNLLSKKNHFESSVGRFLTNLGINLVSDCYHQDLRPNSFEHSYSLLNDNKELDKRIQSSSKFIEIKKDKAFNFKLHRCKICNFKTESLITLEGHYLHPHITQKYAFRCSFCEYLTRQMKAIKAHYKAAHGKKAVVENCPPCSLERFCQKNISLNFNECPITNGFPSNNQSPPFDFEFPAITSKPLTSADIFNYHKKGNEIVIKNSMKIKLSTLLNVTGTNQFKNNSSFAPQFIGQAVNQGINLPSHRMNLVKPPLSTQHVYAVVPNLINYSTPVDSVINHAGANICQPPVALTANICQNNDFKNVGFYPSLVSQDKSKVILYQNFHPSHVNNHSRNFFTKCEICDFITKDLEELCSHMCNHHGVNKPLRSFYPALTCQKCQFPFYTDQGLERHLLCIHGLVTTRMQKLADNIRDNGHCILCSRFTCKLVSHMAQVHGKSLNPVNLTYRCRKCSVTFITYRNFEKHVHEKHHTRLQNTKSVTKIANSTSRKSKWKCKDCGIYTEFLEDHIKQKHIKECSIKLCRIDICKKDCAYQNVKSENTIESLVKKVDSNDLQKGKNGNTKHLSDHISQGHVFNRSILQRTECKNTPKNNSQNITNKRLTKNKKNSINITVRRPRKKCKVCGIYTTFLEEHVKEKHIKECRVILSRFDSKKFLE